MFEKTAFDAFHRLRVSNPTTLFDSQFQYDLPPLLWETVTSGDAAVFHNADAGCVRLLSGTTANSLALRQTRGYMRYQSGKSQLIVLTGVSGDVVDGVFKRMGYFDDYNGIFLEVSDQVYFVLRSSTTGEVVDTKIAQSNWQYNQLSGSVTDINRINLSKTQIVFFDLQALYAGTVRCGFDINGQFVHCCSFHHANISAVPYIYTANLPLRYEIGTTKEIPESVEMLQICGVVMSEGGFSEELGLPFTANNVVTPITVGTRRPILSVRPKLTFNSLVNRGQIVVEDFSILSATQSILMEVVYGGTLTGANFASVNDASIVEKDVAASAISGGITLKSQYMAAATGSGNNKSISFNLLSKLPLSLNRAGEHPTTPYTDNISLVVTAVASSTATTGAINWREIR